MGSIIRIGRDIQCLPYAGFFYSNVQAFMVMLHKTLLTSEDIVAIIAFIFILLGFYMMYSLLFLKLLFHALRLCSVFILHCLCVSSSCITSF